MKAQLLAFISKLLPALILVLLVELLILPNKVSLIYMSLVAPLFTIAYFTIAFILDKDLYFLIKDLLNSNLKRLKAKFKLNLN
jgi:hypothetical protein